MTNKTLLGISLLLTISLTVHAQGQFQSINAFTYNNTEQDASPNTRVASSISGMFKNLHKNVSRLISNPEKIIFLGHKYIATIQNKKEAKRYFLKNWYENAPIIYYFIEGDKVSISLSRLTDFNKEDVSNHYFPEKLSKKIHKGYKVYQMNFKIDTTVIHHYIFVNPKTYEPVISEFSFFGGIPQAKE